MISTLIVRSLAISFMAFPLSAATQAYVAAAPSVRITGGGSGLNWVEVHGYDPSTDRIFFAAEPSASNAPPPQKLYEIAVEGGPMINRSLQTDTERDDVGSWLFSPNGNQIVYRRSDHGSYGDLYAIDTTGGAPRRLTFDYGASQEAGFQFTNAGDRIVYASRTNTSAPYRLYSLSTDGLETPTLLSGAQHRVVLTWELSPDTLHAYYAAFVADNSFRLFRAEVLGGPVIELTERPIARGLYQFDATSGRYAYFAGDTSTGLALRTSAVDAGPEVELTLGGNRFDADSYTRMFGFAGEQIVFEHRGAGLNPFFIADPTTGIVSIIDDGNADSTFYSLMSVSPNGASIFFSETVYEDPRSTRAENGVFQYDVASGAVRELGRFGRTGCCLSPRVTHSPRSDTFVIQDRGFQPTLFAADGSELRSLVGSNFFYDESGDWLFSSDDVDGVQQLFAEPVTSSGARRQLTSDVSLVGILNPILSSDGSVMTYVRGYSDSSSSPRILYAVRLVPEPMALSMVIAAPLTTLPPRRAIRCLAS